MVHPHDGNAPRDKVAGATCGSGEVDQGPEKGLGIRGLPDRVSLQLLRPALRDPVYGELGVLRAHMATLVQAVAADEVDVSAMDEGLRLLATSIDWKVPSSPASTCTGAALPADGDGAGDRFFPGTGEGDPSPALTRYPAG